MTWHFYFLRGSRLVLVLLGLAFVLVGTIGANGVIATLAALGIIKEPSIDFAVLGSVMIIAVWAGLVLLIAGLVLASARGVARKGGWMFLGGLALLVIGSGPLLGVGAAASLGLTADPNPNPVFLGILAFLTFGPAILLVVSGAIVFVIGRLRSA